MSNFISTAEDSSGLGDLLLLTAVLKYKPELKVILHPSCKKFDFIFKGICSDIEYTENLQNINFDIGDGLFAERKMRYFGLHNLDCLPYIKDHKKNENKVKELLKNYDNPIIFKPNCAPRWKHLRQFEHEYWLPILDKIGKDYEILLFGVSDNFTDYNNVTTKFIDLDLELTSEIYRSVGKYIGVDTGDYHLMLSVNGKCEVHVPPSCDSYIHSQWHYKSERVKYIIKEN
jgi:hypothetical protein